MASHSKFKVGDIVEAMKPVKWFNVNMDAGSKAIMIGHLNGKAGEFTAVFRGKMIRCSDGDFKLHARAVPLDGKPMDSDSRELVPVPQDLADFRDKLVGVVRKHLAHGADLSEDDSTLLTDILALLGMKTRVVRKIELIMDEA